jgi:hypothetical protein
MELLIGVQLIVILEIIIIIIRYHNGRQVLFSSYRYDLGLQEIFESEFIRQSFLR